MLVDKLKYVNSNRPKAIKKKKSNLCINYAGSNKLRLKLIESHKIESLTR
jgi:hypothetical protein